MAVRLGNKDAERFLSTGRSARPASPLVGQSARGTSSGVLLRTVRRIVVVLVGRPTVDQDHLSVERQAAQLAALERVTRRTAA